MINEIEFEISESCSPGLIHIIKLNGWNEQKRFKLRIIKSPIVSFLETLIPEFICLFHIGCSTDFRAPSFEHTIKYKDLAGQRLIFSYKRTIFLETFAENKWFHDCVGERNLKSLAYFFSSPKYYNEKIILSFHGRDEKCEDFLGKIIKLELEFQRNKLYAISGFENIQKQIFKVNIKNFENSLLDLNNGPLANESLFFKNTIGIKDWKELLQKNELTTDDLIKEIYRLFQYSAPLFGKRIKIRKALFDYK